MPHVSTAGGSDSDGAPRPRTKSEGFAPLALGSCARYPRARFLTRDYVPGPQIRLEGEGQLAGSEAQHILVERGIDELRADEVLRHLRVCEKALVRQEDFDCKRIFLAEVF